ncbi:phosphatidylinositol phosphatase PTPRQ-like isoform X3 [Adelges cooleyi]|uniref:phosphatidylinositol phosphatase PTPRQ-like isoform X3 n=1 Tax=Adelges cooleyi TaxID=133065 RepID=UPI0021801C85|nr:phosphatidylinositol phosphatase PTPRQ-like isoform X3 [Adelges cooleyi]
MLFKLRILGPPENLTATVISLKSIYLQWIPPLSTEDNIIGYRLTVVFKSYLYEVHKYCPCPTKDEYTYDRVGHGTDTYLYDIKLKNPNQDNKLYQYEIKNYLRPASKYQINVCAVTMNSHGNLSTVTIRTPPTTSSAVVDLEIVTLKSTSVTLSWKQPCEPNGKIAFYHSTMVGERQGFKGLYFSSKHDIIENKTKLEYSFHNLSPEYSYHFTVAPITFGVEPPGQDKTIQFTTLSTSPGPPNVYETYRSLRVTVSENQLTQVRVFLSAKLFSNINGTIRSYSIIVYQDGGFPDVPEKGERTAFGIWPPKMRTWAEASPYPFILAYQTTANGWMPFIDQTTEVSFDVGADMTCRISDRSDYCNGPLRPVTDYRLKLRAFTEHGFQDSWAVPFTTPGEPTAVYYLVLCSVLFAVFITATGICCVLNKNVPWIVTYKTIQMAEGEYPLFGEMSYAQLLSKSPQQIESEFNILTDYAKNPATTDVALMPQNKSKNRYINILPYDYNRVTINSTDGDYINASYIEDYKGTWQYVACQGPIKNTCADMWQMILDVDVAAIVMLCQITEQGKIKCDKYYPDSQEKLTFGDVQVENDVMIVDNEHSYTTRIITVKKGEKKKTIRHFQFHYWPDFGVPNQPSDMVKFCQIVQAKAPAGLIVVHCSAGIGRTGTFIACDILLRQINERTKLDVFKTVLKLREQRTNMVQTQAQYEFVYACLAFFIKKYLLPTPMESAMKKRNASGQNAANSSSDIDFVST